MTSNNTSLPLPAHPVVRLTFAVSSYVVDPQWARKFTIAWTSVTAASIAVSLPYLYRSVKRGRAFTGAFGVTESWKAEQYVPVEEREPRKCRPPWKLWIGVKRARAVLAWTLPGFDVSVGQSGHHFRSHLDTFLMIGLFQCCWWRGTLPRWLAASCLSPNLLQTPIGPVRKPNSRVTPNHFISRNRRLPVGRSTAGCVPLLLEEFRHVAPPRARSRIRETELYSPMGRTRPIPLGRHPW